MRMSHVEASRLFSSGKSIFADILFSQRYPFSSLELIGDFIYSVIKQYSDGGGLLFDLYHDIGFTLIKDGVLAADNSLLARSALLLPPCLIMPGAEIRHGALIRGAAVIGCHAVVGNSCEIKNSVLFDGAAVPHFNYVGDSVIGYRAHLGAGAVISNLKCDKSSIVIRCEDGSIETNRRKVGAFVGDFAEIGCGCVLNPGTVIGRGSTVYPLCSVRGAVPCNSILKSNGELIAKDLR